MQTLQSNRRPMKGPASLYMISVNCLTAILFFCLTSMAVAQSEQSKRITDFVRDIAPLLQEKCVNCHEGTNAKNGFDMSDRDAVMGLIEPGNAAGSSLWNDFLNQPSKSHDKDSAVMPPNGPLNPSQLALMKLWIDEGADWPIGAKVGDGKAAVTNKQIDENVSYNTKVFRAIGYMHPAIVHFPIAFFFLSGACAFLSYFLGPRCQALAFQCLMLATLTSLLTVVVGWGFADAKGYAAWNTMLSADANHEQTNFFMHRWLGTLTPIAGIVVVLVSLIARRNKSNGLLHAWRMGAILMALLVGIVGHQGGELVYGDIFEKAIEQLRK